MTIESPSSIFQTLERSTMSVSSYEPHEPLAGQEILPVTILIDVSGSMAAQATDGTAMELVERAVRAALLEIQSSEDPDFLLNRDRIFLSVVAYSERPAVVVDWTAGGNVAPSLLPALTPQSATATGGALVHALERFWQFRQEKIKAGLAFGQGIIIHLTDGELNDMQPGDDLWNRSRHMAEFACATPGMRSANLIELHHVVQPNGSYPLLRKHAEGYALIHQLQHAGADGLFAMVQLVFRAVSTVSMTGESFAEVVERQSGGLLKPLNANEVDISAAKQATAQQPVPAAFDEPFEP